MLEAAVQLPAEKEEHLLSNWLGRMCQRKGQPMRPIRNSSRLFLRAIFFLTILIGLQSQQETQASVFHFLSDFRIIKLDLDRNCRAASERILQLDCEIDLLRDIRMDFSFRLAELERYLATTDPNASKEAYSDLVSEQAELSTLRNALESHIDELRNEQQSLSESDRSRAQARIAIFPLVAGLASILSVGLVLWQTLARGMPFSLYRSLVWVRMLLISLGVGLMVSGGTIFLTEESPPVMIGDPLFVPYLHWWLRGGDAGFAPRTEEVLALIDLIAEEDQDESAAEAEPHKLFTGLYAEKYEHGSALSIVLFLVGAGFTAYGVRYDPLKKVVSMLTAEREAVQRFFEEEKIQQLGTKSPDELSNDEQLGYEELLAYRSEILNRMLDATLGPSVGAEDRSKSVDMALIYQLLRSVKKKRKRVK